MNKVQNTKVDIAATVGQIQAAGIEVMAGFIFGSDEDTIDTAGAIASFATQVAIPTAMTGMLTPIPHTPLGERLRGEGRLREDEFSGNNTDDAVQFVPRRMSIGEMQRGYYQILESLFAPGAMFQRSRALLDRLEPHIFHGRNIRASDVRAALRSLWLQGVMRASRLDYFRLLWKGRSRDAAQRRAARRALADLKRQIRSLATAPPARFADCGLPGLSPLVAHAQEAMVRADPARRLDDITAWAREVQTRIGQGVVSVEEVQSIYRWSREYFLRQRRLHRFPGAYLVKAFNLTIKGLHYETVMHGLAREGLSGERLASRS
jgi:hypothetical protein